MPSQFIHLPRHKASPKSSAARVQTIFSGALALHQKGQLAQAKAGYQQILKIQPEHFDSLHLLGVIAKQTNNPQQAVELIDKAIEINPNVAATYSNRGNALKELKQLDAAVASYDKAIALNPNYVEAHTNRGIALQELNQPGAAIASYDKAIALNPNYAEAHFNLGVALQELKQLDAAVAGYDKAIALKPDYAEAYSNRGVALEELKQLDAAVASHDKAIALKPDYADAYWNKSLALLVGGDLEKGWELFEWRWKRNSFTAPNRNFTQPLWLGTETIKGKTILLHSEQGLGDTIQFFRYVKLVADLGAKVILELETPLIPLLSSSASDLQVVARGLALPAFDFHCPLLSLPLAFKTSLATIPSAQAYLRVAVSKASEWADKLGVKVKPRAGLVWSGSTIHKNDFNRSIKLSALVPFLPESVEYFSLQKEVREYDQVTLQGYPAIRHFGDELNDFSDTAALCEQMDVVISVDTSVAHLSAALGKATWVLLPYAPDWRWLLDREDTPWYPSARLFRQRANGGWASVFEEVNAALAGVSVQSKCL